MFDSGGVTDDTSSDGGSRTGPRYHSLYQQVGPQKKENPISVTILPNGKKTRAAVLASWIDQVAKACKNHTSERRESDGLAYPWTGKTFTGIKRPYGVLRVRRQHGNVWRISQTWPAGRGGIADGTTDSERIFVFACDEDLYGALDALCADPQNPQPLEIVPHGDAI